MITLTTSSSTDITVIDQACVDAIDRASKRLPMVVEKMGHLSRTSGALGESAAYHLGTGGHLFRARLALASCDALNVDVPSAVSLAAACELLHNASLVHDDIQDGDTVRRHQASVWCRYGVNTAITLGDFFLTLAFVALAELEADASVKAALLQLFSKRTVDVIRGQSREFDITRAGMLELACYESIVREKTGALLTLPMEGALTLAGADARHGEAAHRALGWLGVAYQLRDDLLDFADHHEHNLAASDLGRGRFSAVVLHYLACVDSSEQALLLDFLLKPRGAITNGELSTWMARIAASSAISRTVAHFQQARRRGKSEAATLPARLSHLFEQVLEEVTPEAITSVDVKPLNQLSEKSRDSHGPRCLRS